MIITEKEVRKFQFPSSGKVHPNTGRVRRGFSTIYGFNSLQAGKSIQTNSLGEIYHYPDPSFNSLQAGKSIQTPRLVPLIVKGRVSIPFKRGSPSKPRCLGLFQAPKKVSIPFKRESPSKQYSEEDLISLNPVSIPFKRESPSKLSGRSGNKKAWKRVSIPFKRESPSKLLPSLLPLPPLKGFNFPSSGKVHPNLFFGKVIENSRSGVSIPFKRESPSKLIATVMHQKLLNLVSIPSSGKVHPNTRQKCEDLKVRLSFNSFKRESPSKPKDTEVHTYVRVEFQFPSSGKVHPNKIYVFCESFGSEFQFLQAGKSSKLVLRERLQKV